MAKEIPLSWPYKPVIGGCKVKKIVDVTDDCPSIKLEGRQCIIVYFHVDGRGDIVEFSVPYENGKYVGVSVFYEMKDLSGLFSVLKSSVISLGLSDDEIRTLIHSNAPKF